LSRGGEKRWGIRGRWEASGRLQGFFSQEHFGAAVAEILDEKVAGFSFYQVITHWRRLFVFEGKIEGVGIADVPEMAIVKNKELGVATGGSFDGVSKGAVFIKDDAIVIDGIFIPDEIDHCAAVENDVFLAMDKMMHAVTGGKEDRA
jgi:hypothetical protein